MKYSLLQLSRVAAICVLIVVCACTTPKERSETTFSQIPSGVVAVGDKLPAFKLNLNDFNSGIKYVGGTHALHGKTYNGPLIEIPKNVTFTHPSGKDYTCIVDGGCIIHLKTFAILKGKFKVSSKAKH